MAQHYSNPKRASDAYSLPDLEVWEDKVYRLECEKCGDFDIPEPVCAWSEVCCPSCERSETVASLGGITDKDGYEKTGWFYWFCFPGCLPEGDGYANGPFESEDAALEDARQYNDDDDEE